MIAACSPQQLPNLLNADKQSVQQSQISPSFNYPQSISLSLDTQLLFNAPYTGPRVVLPIRQEADSPFAILSHDKDSKDKEKDSNEQNGSRDRSEHEHEDKADNKCQHKGWDKNRISLDPQNLKEWAHLYPDVPGNKNIPIPETQVAIVSFNNHPPTPIQTGELMVKVAAPVSVNIEKIKRKYNATVLAGPDSEGAYLIRPDMTRVKLNALEQNLKKLNKRLSNPNYIVTNVSFSNLESARTLAFFAELLTSTLAEGVSFNPYLSLDLAKTYESTLKTNLDAEKSWWLNERSINAIEAWEHSLGYNIELDRPVKVAVLDSGFSGLWEHMSQGRDLEGQILYDQGFVLDYDNQSGQTISEKRWTPSLLMAEKGLDDTANHGTMTTSLIVSHINDRNGIAGIAPGAKVIPFKVGSPNWWAVRRGIELARQAGADIVSISLGGGIADTFAMRFTEFSQRYQWYRSMQTELAQATQSNIVVLAAAGNLGWKVDRSIFAGRLDDAGKKVFPELVVVGAVMDDNQYHPERPSFDPNQRTPLAFPTNLKRALFGSFEHLEPPPFSPIENAQTYKDQIGDNWSVYLSNYIDIINGKITTENTTTDPSKLGSNWGNIDISLPGHGMSVLVNPNYNSPPFGITGGSGTSFSTPLAAGLVALMKARNIQINHKNQDPLDVLKIMKSPLNYVSNTYDDFYLRGLPGIQNNTHCGSLKGYNCGIIAPVTKIEEPILDRNYTVEVPLAPRVVAYAANQPNTQAQSYTGKIFETGDSLYLNTSNSMLRLAMAGNRSSNFIKNFFGHDLQNNPVQLSGLIQKEVTVRGWLSSTVSHNDLHILEVIQGQNTSQQCINEEITTDTNWIWFKDQVRNRAVVVPHYLSQVDIAPTQNGRSVLPIWSELTPAGHPYGEGRALCGNCRYDFWYDYAIPTGFKVEEAKLEIQSDDQALFFVNQNYVGSADYGSTFGQNKAKVFTIPTSYFNSPSNATIGVAFSTQATNGAIVAPYESYNYAAVAAKISLKVCPQ